MKFLSPRQEVPHLHRTEREGCIHNVVYKCIPILKGGLNLNAQMSVTDFLLLGAVKIFQGSLSEKAVFVIWIYFKLSFNSEFPLLFLSHLSDNIKWLLLQDFLNISVLTFAAIALNGSFNSDDLTVNSFEILSFLNSSPSSSTHWWANNLERSLSANCMNFTQ